MVGSRSLGAAMAFAFAAGAWAANPIQDRIAEALAAKASVVRIPSGTYRVDSPLRFNDVKNFQVEAAGVMMICTHNGGALAFDRSVNVEVHGLIVDYDPLPFTQGTIIAATDDWNSIDVKLHAGYRTDKPGATRLEVFDPVTRMLRKHAWMGSGNTITLVSPGTWRWTGTKDLKGDASVGDLIVEAYDGGMSITINRCSGITLRDFTHHSSYSYGVLETHSSGSRFLNYRLALGPMPAGADQPRLRTSNYDGMHFIDDRIGPHIEDCLIENLGDDAIAIHGVFGKVTAAVASGKSFHALSVSGGDGDFGAEPGDTLFFMNPDYGFNSLAVATTINGGAYTLDRSITLEAGGLVYNANRIGSGYVIRNCVIRNKRARGILARGSNATIEGNRIEWTQQASLALFPEYGQWFQSGWSRNVKIRGNTFRNAFALGGTSAVDITGGEKNPPAGLFRGIEVVNNVFDSCAGGNLTVGAASGVLIAGNTFKNAMPGGDAVVSLRNSDSVELRQNCLVASVSAKALATAGVTNLIGGQDGIGGVCVTGVGSKGSRGKIVGEESKSIKGSYSVNGRKAEYPNAKLDP